MAVLLETSVGDIAIDLYVDEAPQGEQLATMIPLSLPRSNFALSAFSGLPACLPTNGERLTCSLARLSCATHRMPQLSKAVQDQVLQFYSVPPRLGELLHVARCAYPSHRTIAGSALFCSKLFLSKHIPLSFACVVPARASGAGLLLM